MSKKNIELIPIKNIITKDLQSRASLSSSAIKDYAHDQKEAQKAYMEKAKDGANEDDFLLDHNPLPPGKAYRNGSGKVFLAEGFTRLESTVENGFSAFPLQILEGEKEDAIRHSAGANAEHGERRSKADKKHAVEMILALPGSKDLSNNDIAKLTKTSPWFVEKCRPVAKASVKGRGRPRADGTPAQPKKGKKPAKGSKSAGKGKSNLPVTSPDAENYEAPDADPDLDAAAASETTTTETAFPTEPTRTISDAADRAATRVKNVIGGKEGKAFYDGILDGSLDISASELGKLAELNDGQIKRAAPLVIQNRMSLKKAVEFMEDTLSDKTKEELANRCLAHAGNFSLDFDGFHVQIVKT